MPEGNEIHRWAERHMAAFGGRPVRVDGPQGRFVDADVIDGLFLSWRSTLGPVRDVVGILRGVISGNIIISY